MSEKDNKVAELPGWLQVVFMILPFIGYLITYSFRCYIYYKLGVSTSLVQVKLEDVLFILLTCLLICLSIAFHFVIGFLNTANRREGLRTAWYTVITCLVGGEVVLAAIAYIMAKHVDIVSAITLSLSVLLCVLAWLTKRQGRHFKAVPKPLRTLRTGIMFSVLVICIWHVGAFLAFRSSTYQWCMEDRALIVGYVDDGRAIEKTIKRVDETTYACELCNGYKLVDVSDKEIILGQYFDLYVESSSSMSSNLHAGSGS